MPDEEDIETQIRQRVEAKDHAGAVALAVDQLGDEVYAYVLSRSRDEDEAGDIFAQACEDLVKSMPAFEFRCSVRTWFYRLARSAGARYRAMPSHDRDRRVPISAMSDAIEQVRSRTQLHLRTEVKDGFRKLREGLDPDDQQLLLLRIDRDLGWNEIAIIVDDLDDPAEIARAAAKLRQQFQKLKDHLRQLAIADGLMTE